MAMKIGYIGHFGSYHTELGVAKALEKRATVDCYQVQQFSMEKFLDRGYDMLLTTSPMSLPSDFLSEFPGMKVAHYFDLIVGWRGRESVYFPSLRQFNLTLSPDGFDSSPYTNSGIRRRYFRQAYNPDWYYPIDAEKSREVGFIGHVYGNRQGLVKRLSDKYDFVHLGEDNACRGKCNSTVCAMTKIMIAENATNYVPGYWSNRVYLYLGSKAFVLHPYVKGIEDYFTDGEHLVIWRSEADLFEKIDYYLQKPDKRDKIAEAGYELVSKRDTWEKRMEEFWKILKSGL